jgi:hypothetical protein
MTEENNEECDRKKMGMLTKIRIGILQNRDEKL